MDPKLVSFKKIIEDFSTPIICKYDSFLVIDLYNYFTRIDPTFSIKSTGFNTMQELLENFDYTIVHSNDIDHRKLRYYKNI